MKTTILVGSIILLTLSSWFIWELVTAPEVDENENIIPKK